MTAASVPNPCGAALAAWCARRLPQDVPVAPFAVAVAYSGGADSTALLLAAEQRWPTRVLALHVHHGLQGTVADGFQSHVQSVCQRHGMALRVRRIDAAPAPGQSPEEAARDARYTALAELARQAAAPCVLLGQHADDQAETLLLALSRGAGLPGLAAMPEWFERHGVAFGRPLLTLSSASLRGWLLAVGQGFVDDPSNADLRFTRNRIRALLLPAWQACFPGFRPLLARSAGHAQQAQTLLDDLARLDLQQTGTPPAIVGLRALRRERQGNLLRHWLRSSAGVAASAAQLDELLNQIAHCSTRGQRIRIKVASGFVQRVGERLHYISSI